MDFFKSGLKTVLGQPESNSEPSGAETVEKLVERLSSSTLLGDRRDACRALKSLSRKYRIEVGAQGMSALLGILVTDHTDSEVISYALDTLCNIISQEQFEEEANNPVVSVNVGEQFTEILIKNPENITTILGFLEDYDFRVRWPAIKLLTSLLANRHKSVQEIVLVSPMALSKLMDLLADSREIIRNDALLLLIELTKSNTNIQKIVAFENAFDRLFDVITDEGGSDGGIVVEDCLILMLNLLKNNSSNQQFFKEGSYIQRLTLMLKFPYDMDENNWTPQKVSNVHCMLQIVRTLVSPSNSQVIISSCQKTMRNCGLLEVLCNILMASGIPSDILTETISTVGEVIRGDIANQEYLDSVMAPSDPPQPAIVVLLMSMINEKQPLTLRCAVLYCFQSYLYQNDRCQTKLVQTLLPSSPQMSTLTIGQILCGGTFSNDPVSNWFSLNALMHSLIGNPKQKEEMLRVLLATSIGSQPISLLEQCTILLQQSKYKFQSKIGVLMLLSTWLYDCQLAVKAFLSIQNIIPSLIAQIGASEHDDNEFLLQGLCAFLIGLCIQFNDNSLPNNKSDELIQLIKKRIGLEEYTKKIGEVSKHEAYNRAAKVPQIRVKNSSELILDYEFCKLFKTLEVIITSTITARDNQNNELGMTTQDTTEEIIKYKNIIREQDCKLQSHEKSIKRNAAELESLKVKISEIQSLNSQLQDQNILLKAQLTAAIGSKRQQGQTSEANSQSNSLEKDVLPEKLKKLDIGGGISSQDELEALRKDQDDLLELLAEQESRIRKYRDRLVLYGVPVTDDEGEE